MRLRNNPKAKELIENHREIVLKTDEPFDLKNIFTQDQPLRIEIGMGKGDFIIEMAKRYPQINFIGIEKYDSVLVAALKKLIDEEPLPNLRLMCFDAAHLQELFPAHSIEKIYLNFSDPWPKSKHDKRRLTYRSYLRIYELLLKEGGDIEFKTDNRGLFEFSLVSMNQYPMDFKDICLDLHHADGYEDNIMTEYERKFSPFGPIYKIQANFR
ncbi:tRNA (guanosine(46)-N7)-methyltransferase TrmB [Beduini massiliensis]|uniref:tRNA (guanosine(46)-N7)-methyltransferase TrmB n=1 Tax=Beduini massiliensis TaxID=1585974 RepID=UPI00059AACA8|nr:tRNA (guanosine(46)-N7)-methyltransferase TrmB [Beduini massiliensis]